MQGADPFKLSNSWWQSSVYVCGKKSERQRVRKRERERERENQL